MFMLISVIDSPFYQFWRNYLSSNGTFFRNIAVLTRKVCFAHQNSCNSHLSWWLRCLKAPTCFPNMELNELHCDKTNKMTVHPAKTRISLGIRPVWSESSLCTQWVAKDPSFLRADSEGWSDWADAQADLSLCWAAHAILLVLSRVVSNEETCQKIIIGFLEEILWWMMLLCELNVLSGKGRRKRIFDFKKWLHLSLITRKRVFGGFRPGKTQPGLLSYRS